MKTLKPILFITVLATACGGTPTGPKLPVQVPAGASFSQIADSLAARGIIGNKPLFRLYARVTGADSRVRPGTYGFQKGESWQSGQGTCSWTQYHSPSWVVAVAATRTWPEPMQVQHHPGSRSWSVMAVGGASSADRWSAAVA